ncbi:hypothetical protein [Nocardia sp. alder85J]|uniref:hypothetical protein n=1 Tax=Nocardia sp. alder85J TaxID=2862949 RepID=UPI001CD286E8|nr:hypothetical protein [Nocardia sp. alder85J]MCX4091372.1 hypothetical protein [Nocardia sp. alder85J]
MRARTMLGAAVAAAGLSVAGGAVAGAAPMRAADLQVDVAPYLVGDTVYFSAGGANCSIHPDGSAGCDIPAGIAKWYNILPVTDLVIDIPFLPAHPEWVQHGQPGSLSLPSDANGYDSTISYAGASCYGGGRGAIGCTSKGHSFSFGWSGTQTS